MFKYSLVRPSDNDSIGYIRDDHYNTIASVIPHSEYGVHGNSAVLDMIEAMLELVNASISSIEKLESVIK